MNNRIIIAIVSVMVLIVVGLIGLIVTRMDSGPPTGLTTNMEGGFNGSAVDSAARIEIEVLRQQIEALTEKINSLEGQISQLSNQIDSRAAVPSDPQIMPRDGPNQIVDAYAQVVLIANRRNVNKGITVASPSYLEKTLGRPRANLGNNCQAMTNEKLRAKLVTEQVGPIRVRMMRPAIESLKRVFARIEATDPDLYARINTAGALCVRQIRGTVGRLSTHSFGLSLDLNIDGKLDTLGDGKTQLGLTILADFFREEGWFWGAGFSREDSMHFEVSREMVEQWRREGKL